MRCECLLDARFGRSSDDEQRQPPFDRWRVSQETGFVHETHHNAGGVVFRGVNRTQGWRASADVIERMQFLYFDLVGEISRGVFHRDCRFHPVFVIHPHEERAREDRDVGPMVCVEDDREAFEFVAQDAKGFEAQDRPAVAGVIIDEHHGTTHTEWSAAVALNSATTDLSAPRLAFGRRDRSLA